MDFWRHIEYTEIIALEHRMPAPYEKLETYQPPLYYLINSFIVPDSLLTNKTAHINFVELLSMIYGAISLFIILWLIQQVSNNVFAQLITISFIATTPKFLFNFCTYSNDSLSTMFCIAVSAIAYKLYKKWSWDFAILLLVLATCGIYTKYTMIWCIFIISIICSKNLLKLRLPNKFQIGIIGILLTSVLLFMPWAFFHNYHHSGKLLPFRSVDEHMMLRGIDIPEHIRTLKTILKVPILSYTPQEWSDPWVHPWLESELAHPATKKNDYLSYIFISSIIGEFEFSKPNIIVIWIILWIHLFVYLLCLKEIFRSDFTKLALSVILLSHLTHILNLARLKTPFTGFFMDYRFLLWNSIAWAILYVSALSAKSKLSKEISTLLSTTMIIGIIFQVYFLMTAS